MAAQFAVVFRLIPTHARRSSVDRGGRLYPLRVAPVCAKLLVSPNLGTGRMDLASLCDAGSTRCAMERAATEVGLSLGFEA